MTSTGFLIDLSLISLSAPLSDGAWKRQGQEDEPAQLILTVEYTRAAPTALLVFEYRRVLHDTRLGADGLGLSSNSSRSRDDLARALRELTPSAARRRRQWR